MIVEGSMRRALQTLHDHENPGEQQGGTVAGILLAAGEGSRLGRPKALVEVGGMRLIDRGVALLRDGGASPVLAVTGAVAVSVLGVVTVDNRGWRSGMGSSLSAGLSALPADCP